MAAAAEGLKRMVILGSVYPANKLEPSRVDLYITLLLQPQSCKQR